MRTTLRQLSSRALSAERSRTPFVCSRCRNSVLFAADSSSPSLIQSIQRRAESTGDKLPFGEKLRRKIWGTDKPPGQRNPYEQLTPEERAKQLEEREIEEREASASREKQLFDRASDQEYADAPAPITDGYVPAATWDGLDQVGGAHGWWEEAWDQEHQFVKFARQTKTDPGQTRVALRRALVEMLALQGNDRPLADASILPVDNRINLGYVKIVISEKNKFDVQYEDPAVRHDLLKQIENGEDNSEEMVNSMEPTSATPEDCKWLQVPIDDLDFKFTFLKRATQLTGITIPDPAIQKLRIVEDALSLFTKKPEPKKLAEALLARPDLLALPNVEIFSKRHTPIDKEMEVGRWKVIEQELKKRDLPVTGHR